MSPITSQLARCLVWREGLGIVRCRASEPKWADGTGTFSPRVWLHWALNGSKPNIVCGDSTTFFPALVSVPIAIWMHRHKDLRRALRMRTSTDRIWYIPPLPALLLIVRSYLQSFFDWIRCAFGSSRATYMYYPDITITVRITQKGHRLNEALYPLLPHNAIRPLT